ncbi:MAG: glycosyltransferase family 2 protein [Pseudolabrys sp.]|nr:glycosyltransferase family 2 protein [Pseudolabrys sp.]
MSDQTPTVPGPALAVVIPTRDEHGNIMPLYGRLCVALQGINWEVIFVDDDSGDGTPDIVRRLAESDRRVRLLRRIGRRGLSSACIEGIQASSTPFIAVIDADMQHDESLLPRMLAVLQNEPVDIVVGSRYAADGGVGDWNRQRARLSELAVRLSRRLLHVSLSDPVSGFFMIRRDAFEASMRRLSTLGFKILVDILVSSRRPLRIREMAYQFRSRQAGESKFDALIGWEYLVLLLDKLIGHILPIRFVLFTIVGGVGILAHLLMLWLFFEILRLSFPVSQTAATIVAMIGNFTLNNWLTYRDMRLSGWRWLAGLLSFCLICSVGAAANIGIASFLFGEQHSSWWIAGIAGALMSLVWNYTMTSMVTWRKPS